LTEPSSPVSGVAERYASALFELARDEGALGPVERDLRSLQAALGESADLRRFVASPVFSAEEQMRAIGAVADRAGMHTLTGNFLRLVARNRRLFALPGMARAFLAMAARARGEMRADVTSARPLSPPEIDELRTAIGQRVGGKVVLDARVDPGILGGLVVKIGSRMIDSSLRTKLDIMKTRLKGA